MGLACSYDEEEKECIQNCGEEMSWKMASWKPKEMRG
jgi:hypothetical protein